MDTDNSVGIDCGSVGWAWQRRAKGENWDNGNRITIKKRNPNSSQGKLHLGPAGKMERLFKVTPL